MKVLYFGSLLLVIGRILAEDVESEQSFEISEECQAELKKYEDCLSNFNMESENGNNMMESKESIQKFCTTIESNDCKAFLADISKAETPCINSASPNPVDLMMGMAILSLKISHSLVCAKGNDGNICPLGKYLQDHTSELVNDNDSEENAEVTLNSEQLQALANDCSDSKCNARMLSMFDFIASIENMFTTIDENPSISSVDSSEIIGGISSYISYYKEKKCSAISNSESSSGGTNSSDTSNTSSGSNPQSGSNSPTTPSDEDSGVSFTFKRITYSFIAMVLFSSIFLI